MAVGEVAEFQVDKSVYSFKNSILYKKERPVIYNIDFLLLIFFSFVYLTQ